MNRVAKFRDLLLLQYLEVLIELDLGHMNGLDLPLPYLAIVSSKLP